MSSIGPTVGVTPPSYAGRTGAATTGPSFPPLVGGTQPSMYADFVGGNYWAGGVVQASLAAFLTATSASYTGPASKYVISSSGVLTSVTPSLAALPFDYGWSGSAFVPLGLLLEGTSTNNALQSNTLSTTWTKNNSTVAQNVTGPDNVANSGWTLTASTAAATNVSQTASAVCRQLAVYAKAGTASFAVLGIGGTLTYFNLTTGAVGTNGNTGATITTLANGWYRCAIYKVTASATLLVGGADANGTNSMALGHTVLLYGAQGENIAAGAYGQPTSTSYIPTLTGPVTRTADVLMFAPAGGFTGAATMTAQVNFWAGANGTQAQAAFVELADGTATNSINSRIGSALVVQNTVLITSFANNPTNAGPNKLAFSASVAAGGNVVVNAGATAAAAIAAMPAVLTTLSLSGLDAEGAPGYNVHSDYAALGVWPVAATVAQLQALTT